MAENNKKWLWAGGIALATLVNAYHFTKKKERRQNNVDLLVNSYATGVGLSTAYRIHCGDSVGQALVTGAKYGVVIGSAFATAGWLVAAENRTSQPELARPTMDTQALVNGIKGMGKVGKEAIALLNQVPPEIFHSVKKNGIMVAPPPSDWFYIQQHKER